MFENIITYIVVLIKKKYGMKYNYKIILIHYVDIII